MKSALERELSADQLFERAAGSTPASLSYVRGYLSNMALGTVKRSIGPNTRLNSNLGFFIPSFKSLFGIIFSTVFRESNNHKDCG